MRMKCISCSNPIPDGATVCKLCGASQKRPSKAEEIILATKAKTALLFAVLSLIPTASWLFDASGSVFCMAGTFFGLPCGLAASMAAFRLQTKGHKSRLATSGAVLGALGALLSGVAAVMWAISTVSNITV